MTDTDAVASPFDQGITFLMVSDMAKSRCFYEEILALPLVLVQTGGCRIYQVSKTTYLGLCDHVQVDEQRPQDIILCLVTDNVDAWAVKLQAHGLTLEKPPQPYDQFDIYHLMVRDPDGYLIEIQKFNDPGWLNLADTR